MFSILFAIGVPRQQAFQPMSFFCHHQSFIDLAVNAQMAWSGVFWILVSFRQVPWNGTSFNKVVFIYLAKILEMPTNWHKDKYYTVSDSGRSKTSLVNWKNARGRNGSTTKEAQVSGKIRKCLSEDVTLELSLKTKPRFSRSSQGQRIFQSE